MSQFFDELNLNYDNIFDPDSKEMFIKDFYGHQGNLAVIDIIRKLNRVGIIENQLNKDLCFFNLREIINLFEQLKWISSGSFSTNKNLIQNYFKWNHEKGKINYDNIKNIEYLKVSDLSGDALYRQSYFKDFNELNNAVNATVDSVDVPDSHRFDTELSIIYLSWIGFTLVEISNMLKSDVSIVNNSIKCSYSNKNIDNIPDYIMDFLREYRESTGYDVAKGFAEYKRGNYLIRTRRINDIDTIALTDKVLRTCLSNFSKLTENIDISSPFYGKTFIHLAIYSSGIFNRLYEYETSNNMKITNKDSELFQKIYIEDKINYVKSVKIYNNYIKWRKYFYGI
jgi:hypothetical protein